MKNSFLVSALTLIVAWLTTATTGAAVLLEWERSTDLRTWEKVPARELIFTADGGIVVSPTQAQTYYRLRIGNGQGTGFLQVIPLGEAPREAVDIASGFLRDHLRSSTAGGEGEGNPDQGWPEDAQLAPICYPVFDLAVEKGERPAYLEFKVIRKPTEQKPNEGLPMSPPDEVDDNRGFGYILIALTTADMPVPEFSERGATKVERLLSKARGGGPIKPMRFDGGLIMAEDEGGKLVGSIGNEPFLLEPEILSIAGRVFGGFADEGGSQQDDSPKFNARRYESYDDLKNDFVSNPLYEFFRKERANQAKPQWTLIRGNGPVVFTVAPQKTERFLAEQKIESASVDDSKIATVRFEPGGNGLFITGVDLGATLLRVRYTDGAADQFIVSVSAAIGLDPLFQPADWTPWRYSYAGSWGDQRRYRQFDRDPLMCTGGASGCGPTAWAMLYGWWDLRGSRRLIGNFSSADAPLYNNSDVLACTRYVFNRVAPLCVSGQAATMPWSMAEGYRWAGARGAGYSITWFWGVPYVSPGVRNHARDSIRAGRPSIVGLGFYWHYPLAYGYATRDYVFLGITWDTAHYFHCNMGWGGGSPEWHSGASTWFSTNARYF
jgi:hypothetical protein